MITIIIPIKDTKIEYFKQCLYSLNTQVKGDFSVTVVNDGSNIENTELYLEAIATLPTFPIEMIHTGRPVGPGPARQYGLDKTSYESDFILFLDSDDMLYPNGLKALLFTIVTTGADSVHGKLFGEKETPAEDRILEEKEIGGRVTGVLYRKSFLDKYDIRFLDKKMFGAEDSYFALVVANLASKQEYIETPVYYWRYNQDSITRSKKTDFPYEINAVHAYSQYEAGNKIMEYIPHWNFGGILAVLYNNYQYAIYRGAEEQVKEIEGYAIELLSRQEIREKKDDENIVDWINKYQKVLGKVSNPSQSYAEWEQGILNKITDSN